MTPNFNFFIFLRRGIKKCKILHWFQIHGIFETFWKPALNILKNVCYKSGLESFRASIICSREPL